MSIEISHRRLRQLVREPTDGTKVAAQGLMSSPSHAAVWIDHHEARIFRVEADRFDEKTIQSPKQHIHRHPKTGSEAPEHPDDLKRFFEAVAKALADATEVLVLGPSTAKLQLVKFAHERDRALATKIVGVETVDHPTDAQIVAYVKRYFRTDP